MKTEWPTRPAGAPARRNDWLRRLGSADLNLLRAVLHLGAGRVPPWAGDLVAGLRAKADDAPEPETSAPAPAGPRPDDLLRGSGDFAAALAAAWPRATPATRTALRTVAAALGIEPPPEPESARVAPDPDPAKGNPPADPMPPAGAPLAPDPDLTGDQPTPAPASAAEPPAPDPKPARRRPRTCWEHYWDLGDEDDDDPFEGRTPLGWANGV